MDTDKIPHRRERLIINELFFGLYSLYREAALKAGVKHRDFIMLPQAIYMASLNGRGVTLSKICAVAKIPRATAQRQLDFLVKQEVNRREGRQYWISDEIMMHPRFDFNGAIRKIRHASKNLDGA